MRDAIEFAKEYTKENKDEKAFLNDLDLDDTDLVFEQQNELIAVAKLAMPETAILEKLAHLCKALSKPQHLHELIVQYQIIRMPFLTI